MEKRECAKCNKKKDASLFIKSKVKRRLCKKCFFNIYIKKPKTELFLSNGEVYVDCYLDNKFIVTNFGRVVSKPFMSKRKNGWSKERGWMELKQTKNKNGYLTVRINKVTKSVHRLVLSSFTGKNNLFVNHIDGIKTNNKLINLEWVTNSENLNHAVSIGLIKTVKVDCFTANGVFIKKYNSVRDASLNTKVANSNIYAMMNNKKYPKSAKGFIFKRAIDINTLKTSTDETN